MKITVIVEGGTEKAFGAHLRDFLQPRLTGRMPNLDFLPYHGRIPSGEKLRRSVNHLLFDRRSPSDHVIALTDVYTGANPPDFFDASDAKSKLRLWVGDEPRFHPHAAQFEFEAWLLPYWTRIQEMAGHNQAAPGGDPESVNHNNPPARRIKEVFRRGRGRYDYVKPRDASRILREQDLSLAIGFCPELKSLVNSILSICEGDQIP